MSKEQHVFTPDYALHPGALLGESIDSMGISARELARRCGRSPKLIVEILSGKASLETETALQLELVTDINAAIWLSLEAAYQLRVARAKDDTRRLDDYAWANRFPLPELKQRNYLPLTKDKPDTVRKLLQYFGVASVEACEEYFLSLAVSYRHSSSFETNKYALFAWLRVGELRAATLPCREYDRAAFQKALHQIRSLTMQSVTEFLPEMTRLCSQAGVAFLVEKPFGGMALSGVSRWLNPRRALIQQTMRHMANDHFWFTFFHEAAHILHHSRKTVFVDGMDGSNSEEEKEANVWAAEFLVPSAELSQFIARGSFTERSVRDFSNEIGIAPGIVVGQLQKRGHLHYSKLNGLKNRYEWK